MSKYPYGFWFFVSLLFLALLPSLPSWGQEIVISETMWNGFKLEYAQLVKANESLADSLQAQSSTVLDLRKSLANQWLDLNRASSTAQSLRNKLETAQTQAVILGNQLAESENGLDELRKSIRAEKVKAYLIGGGVGVVVGVIAGVFLGVYLGG